MWIGTWQTIRTKYQTLFSRKCPFYVGLDPGSNVYLQKYQEYQAYPSKYFKIKHNPTPLPLPPKKILICTLT